MDDIIIIEKIKKHLETIISKEVKYVFEEKHLYQNHDLRLIDFKEIFLETDTDYDVTELEKGMYKELYLKIPQLSWNFGSGFSRIKYSIDEESNNLLSCEGHLQIKSPSPLKLFCPICKNLEPYNHVSTNILLDNDNYYGDDPDFPKKQLFKFAYRCQSCRGLPVVFILYRNNIKISLHGRSPIEQFPVNKNIPKNHTLFFSDSQIAFNSGQILAAIFLLRTFIEQYIRNVVKDHESREIDKLFEQYTHILTDDFNSRFPSLKAVYDRLSEDMHSAIGSDSTYENAKKDVEDHFEALQLFKKHNLIKI